MSARRSYTSTERSRRGATSTFGSRTDVGCLRDHNEDSLTVEPPLYVVADGMGGHAAGEVASEIAVETISQLAPKRPDGAALAKAVEEANRAIIEAAQEGLGREGMGTTVTAAMLEGERLVIAQVGDSRAYLLHQGRLQQLTRDHSLMADMIEAGQLTPEEARTHPQRSVITRALGSSPDTRPDIYELTIEAGDRLLLCSDGLSTMLLDSEIESTLRRVQDPQRCATQLVNEAVAAGGFDNVTVVVVDATELAEKRRRRMARKTKLWVAFIVVLFAAIVGGAVWGTNAYLNTVAYLTEEDGMVAIYRGVPGTFMGMSFSELERVTDVAVDDLQPGVASRLEDCIRVDDLQAAEDLVASYEQDIAERSGEADSDEDADADAEDADSEDADADSEG